MDQSYKTTFTYLKDLPSKLNQEIGLSQWYTITQEQINTFADITMDQQWIHTDPEKCKLASPYGTPIAHGFLVLSLASKFAYDCYTIEDIAMGINYGLDRVRFPNATPVNAQLRGRLILMEYKEIPQGAQFKVQITFELKGQEKPACVAEFIARAYTR